MHNRLLAISVLTAASFCLLSMPAIAAQDAAMSDPSAPSSEEAAALSAQSKLNAIAQHVNRGNNMMRNRQYQAALAEYDAAKKIDPKNSIVKQNIAECRNNMGISLYRQKNFPDAIVQFEKCLAISPGHAQARRNINLCRQVMDQEGISDAPSSESEEGGDDPDKKKTAEKPADGGKPEDTSPKIVGSSSAGAITSSGAMFASGNPLYPTYSSEPSASAKKTAPTNPVARIITPGVAGNTTVANIPTTATATATPTTTTTSPPANVSPFSSTGNSVPPGVTPGDAFESSGTSQGQAQSLVANPAAGQNAGAGGTPALPGGTNVIAAQAPGQQLPGQQSTLNQSAATSAGQSAATQSGSAQSAINQSTARNYPVVSQPPVASDIPPITQPPAASQTTPYPYTTSTSPASSGSALFSSGGSSTSAAGSGTSAAGSGTSAAGSGTSAAGSGTSAAGSGSSAAPGSDISPLAGSGSADGNTLEDKIGKIELKVYGKKNEQLPIVKRIEQLEVDYIGQAKQGSLNDRVENLRKAIMH